MYQIPRLAFAVVLIVLVSVSAHAQQPFAAGLLAPDKVILTPRGNLLVAEAGNGPNTGRVSLVDRVTGQRRTIVAGLPSGIDSEKEPSGPSGLAIRGNTLYISIGGADQTLAGPAPGSEVPNPSPASPLLSSVLALDMKTPIDDLQGSFTITAGDQSSIAGGSPVSLGSGTNAATLRLFFNQINDRSEPRPDFPQNVRGSDPYGVALLGDTLYLADAGLNEIEAINLGSGAASTLVTFPPIPNPTPVGPPVVDAVPDSIRVDGDRLLVTLLTGFPFASGVSSVVSIDPHSGAVTPIISGLTTALDVVPLNSGSRKTYVIAEISTKLTEGAPGRILLQRAGGEATAIVPEIAFPTSVAVDARTGEIFATQIFPGILARIDASGSLPAAAPSSIIPVVASVPGAFGSRFETSLQLSNGQPFPVSGTLNVLTAGGTARVPYQLAAFQTIAYTNLFSTAGLTGGGTVDIDAAAGPAPVALARIFDTSRNTASTGTIIPQVSPDDALYAGDKSVLVAAADPSVSRTNIGVRALNEGAVVTFTLYRNGAPAATATRTLAANALEQQSLDGLFSTSATGNETVLVEVVSGGAIPYAAIVNDATQVTSYQRGRRLD
jgi:hypothetical protein